ncbi:MAG: serine hydrolase [Bacteroidota bacterium]
MRISIVLTTTLFLSLNLHAQKWQKQVKILDKYIENAIEQWEAPGLAVAVVKDGEIVFTKGYGTRTIGKNEPVDEHTLFVCASTTKAFTAAALAILADEGKINWDDKVINHLPELQLYDPYITREITIRDLLTHRTGLGNTDYLWSMMNISGDSALYKIREAEPSYSLRSGFIYQNLMYLAAGKVVEKAGNQSWEDMLISNIYKPLDMNETYAYYKRVKDNPNIANAHYKIDDKIITTEQLVADEIGPAGSMWSSISDMATWIKFLLDNGIYNGDTLISSKNFNELFKPQQIIPPNQFYPSQRITKPNWTTYGLGWFQHDYKGRIVNFHTGSLPGMVAIAGLMPEENIGVYVFSNLDHVEIRHAIMYTTFDLFMDNKITYDWSTELKKLYNELRPDEEEPEKVENAPATIALDSLIGEYFHEHYGTISISKSGDAILFDLNNTIKGTLEHWHYNTYQITFDKEWYGAGMAIFRMNSEAKIDHLEVFDERFDYQKKKN